MIAKKEGFECNHSLRGELDSIYCVPHDSLKEFAEQRGITYPLLSDEGSHTIDAYGIRDAQGEGIPHPGTILIDSAGFIRAKLFQEGFAARHSVEALIAAAKGLK